MACYRLPLSASALLLLNFHVFVHTPQLHIVHFISLQIDLIVLIKIKNLNVTADVLLFSYQITTEASLPRSALHMKLGSPAGAGCR